MMAKSGQPGYPKVRNNAARYMTERKENQNEENTVWP